MSVKSPVVLVVLDGFGYRKDIIYNAVAQAHKPLFNSLLKNYPWKFLAASGQEVGLLPGMIGNSEVGHMTIGAGRIIEQPIVRINRMIDDGSFFTYEPLMHALRELKQVGGTLHILGLLSDAGVHGHEKHIYAYIKAAQQVGVTDIVIHPFLDGRDVAPQSAAVYLGRLEKKLQELGIGKIGSLHGRFYAMDRDHHGERTAKSYEVLTQNSATTYQTWQEAVDYFYHHNIFDEFIVPVQLGASSVIKNNDGVIFANFRPDRARQLIDCLQRDQSLKLCWILTPVPLENYKNIRVLLDVPLVPATLKEVLSAAGNSLFSIAETEKYAHVTYFFGGGRERPFDHELQEIVPSLSEKTYIDHPRMSADEITSRVLYSLGNDQRDFYLINYANADMVGHSGNLAATIKAVEVLDEQLAILYQEVVAKRSGVLIITGDHGKAETMFDAAMDQPCTAHTTNPVYFVVVSDQKIDLPETLHGLADIAPFIITFFGIPVPSHMKK